MTTKNLNIAIDFDGTLVRHSYPDIGEENPGAIDCLKWLQSEGARLILLTMRSDEYLDDAVRWCKRKGIEFWAVNNNQEQEEWTNSRKVYAHIYIDDAALGCPLNIPPDGKRPYVDWVGVRSILIDKVREWQLQPHW